MSRAYEKQVKAFCSVNADRKSGARVACFDPAWIVDRINNCWPLDRRCYFHYMKEEYPKERFP
jgi:hypothetical protein